MPPIGGMSYGQSDFFTPLDDIPGEERQLVKSFGQGVYKEEPIDSNYHYRLRMCLSTGLALMDASDFRVWMNAQPTKSIDFLAEWEETLGLSIAPYNWTTEDRWERLRTRMLFEYSGADPITLGLAVVTLVYRHLYGWSYEYIYDLYFSVPLLKYVISETDNELDAVPIQPTSEYNRYEIAIIASTAIYDDKALWKELCALRDRMSPAYVRIAISCTNCDRVGGGRRPQWRWGQSRWSRDCWGNGVAPSV